MTYALMPLCPMIPALLSQPVMVLPQTVTPITMELLEDNPAVTITGADEQYWYLNANLGKTPIVKNRLIPAFRKRGETVSYMNIQKLVMKRAPHGYRRFKYAPLLRKAERLRDVDVLVIDEIHHTFPFERYIKTREVGGEPYTKSMALFWERVARHLAKGGKAVFITAIHPFSITPTDDDTKDMLITEPMLNFFASPVLELRSSRQER